jgi:hypothetical protein
MHFLIQRSWNKWINTRKPILKFVLNMSCSGSGSDFRLDGLWMKTPNSRTIEINMCDICKCTFRILIYLVLDWENVRALNNRNFHWLNNKNNLWVTIIVRLKNILYQPSLLMPGVTIFWNFVVPFMSFKVKSLCFFPFCFMNSILFAD